MDEGTPLLLMGLTGLVFFGIGVWMLLKNNKLKRICTQSVIGVVESVNRNVELKTDDDGSYRRVETYVPTFVYTVDGVEYKQISNVGKSRIRFSPGDSVAIYFNPEDPRQYYVPEYASGNTAGLISLAAGALFIVLIIYAYLSDSF